MYIFFAKYLYRRQLKAASARQAKIPHDNDPQKATSGHQHHQPTQSIPPAPPKTTVRQAPHPLKPPNRHQQPDHPNYKPRKEPEEKEDDDWPEEEDVPERVRRRDDNNNELEEESDSEQQQEEENVPEED